MVAHNSSDRREELRTKMIENAAEINRLNNRIHETYKSRDESGEHYQDWSRACAEFHARYDELCLPGGPYPDFYGRIRAGDPDMVEVALCFLEVRPFFFRSGYHWKTILQKCKSAPMSDQHSERFRDLLERYTQWRNLRKRSSERGAAIANELWPLLRRFHDLFPVRIADHRYDGLVTVGDLYRILCQALKVEPLADPDQRRGEVRALCRAVPRKDMVAWAREYDRWRRAAWSEDDVWATLVSLIRDVYGLGPTFEVSVETALRDQRPA
jgi:hypothetical protein